MAEADSNIPSPESNHDVDSEQEADALPQTRSHGGVRNTKRYGDKLLALEAHNIRFFLAEKRCYCGKDCLQKLQLKGEEGERVVYDLRAQRFESESS